MVSCDINSLKNELNRQSEVVSMTALYTTG